MAYTSSVGVGGPDDDATDYIDLLDKLVTFATANGWTLLEDTADKVVLEGEGDGSEQITIAFQKYTGGSPTAYGWHLNAYTGYNDNVNSSGNTLAFFNQPGAYTHWMSIPLWNSTIPYWFVVNTRRIIVVAQVDNTFQQCYMGHFLPYASPEQWPYPIVIGASYIYGDHQIYSTSYPRYSDGTASASCYWRGLPAASPGGTDNSTCAILLPNGMWINEKNYMESSSWPSDSTTGMYPYAVPDPHSGLTIAAQSRPALDGSDVILPIECWVGGYYYTTPSGVLGTFDGVYFVSGDAHGSGDEITIDGTDYLVVPNVSRTGIDQRAVIKLA